jgi:hypothetical protein
MPGLPEWVLESMRDIVRGIALDDQVAEKRASDPDFGSGDVIRIRQSHDADANSNPELRATPAFAYREHFTDQQGAYSLSVPPREDRIGWWTP